MTKFFKLKEHNTTVSKEVLAGFTTFFAMAYILFVNPTMLSQDGTLLPYGAVFLATIFSAVIGTLIMGLFANVPYAVAPGMGLNAFFTFTVVFAYGFTPYEALAMVFICGVINILITVTRIRKLIVKSIPLSLQNAIGGGIGIFIAYLGFLNSGVNLIGFGSGVPAMTVLNNPGVILFVIGLILTIVLMIKKVKGAILIGIVVTTLLSFIPSLGMHDFSTITIDFGVISQYFSEMGGVVGKAVSPDVWSSLFSDSTRLLKVFGIIFAFSLTDTFDTIGTFIGTGRRTGIFSADDEKSLEDGKGFSSRLDKALFADSTATSIGAVLGTSNATTYVESAAGIEAGGRTGLTSVVVALLFLASILLAPIAALVPGAATAPALVVVGILMSASFADINWTDFEEAVPCFFAGTFTALAYSVSEGIAVGFIFYTIIKLVTGKYKDLNPIIIVSTILFIMKYVIDALIH